MSKGLAREYSKRLGVLTAEQLDAALALGDGGRVRRFTDTYRARHTLRPGFVERYRMVQLFDCVAIWEYGQRNNLWFRPDQRLRPHAESFTHTLTPFS